MRWNKKMSPQFSRIIYRNVNLIPSTELKSWSFYMSKYTVYFLAGLACLLVIAAGCTSTSSTAPVTTPAPMAATALPTAMATETVPVTGTSAVLATANATTALPVSVSPAQSWSGTWNSSWTSADNVTTVEVLSLTQTGSAVNGSYDAGVGLINASVNGRQLTGTWSDSDSTGNYSGMFEFELSADTNAFTGRWISSEEGQEALSNSTRVWNGVRV
jgi:hypothetical protein